MTLKDEIEKLIQQETKRLQAEGKKNAQAHQKIVAEFEKLTPLLKKLVSAIDPRFIEAEYHDHWACIEISDRKDSSNRLKAESRWIINAPPVVTDDYRFTVKETMYVYSNDPPEWFFFKTELALVEHLAKKIAKEVAAYRYKEK